MRGQHTNAANAAPRGQVSQFKKGDQIKITKLDPHSNTAELLFSQSDYQAEIWSVIDDETVSVKVPVGQGHLAVTIYKPAYDWEKIN
jgi:hypothetical protein